MPASGCAPRSPTRAALKPFLKQPRIPARPLGKLRRAIEADGEFRTRLSAGALPELVDPIGIEWLRREDGWEARVAELIAATRGGRGASGSRGRLASRRASAGGRRAGWRSAPAPS